MKPQGPDLGVAVCVALFMAGTSLAQNPGQCTDQPGSEVFSFHSPPPAKEPLRPILSLGRSYLTGLATALRSCQNTVLRHGPASGYVVATLRKGAQVRFAAPEPIAKETLACLEQGVRRHPPPNPARSASDEVQQAVLLLAPPPPPVAANASAPPQTNKRTFPEIEAAVRRHIGALGACIEELWEERPHAAGMLVVKLRVAETGVVEEASVLRRERTMAAAEPCLLGVMARLKLPARPGLGPTVMSYPLLLTYETP